MPDRCEDRQPVDDARLAELQRLANKGEADWPQPWEMLGPLADGLLLRTTSGRLIETFYGESAEAKAAYITAACESFRPLVAELVDLRARLAQIQLGPIPVLERMLPEPTRSEDG